MLIAATGALLLLGQTATASAAPSSRWSLKIEPARCRLDRRNVDPPYLLSIDTTPGSDSYRLVIASRDIKGPGSLSPASLTFGPLQKSLAGSAGVGKRPDGTPFFRMEGVSPALLDDLSNADTMTISIRSKVVAVVSVPGAGKAIEAFRRCSADQLMEWGADAAQFAPGGRTPVALKDRDSWISVEALKAIAGSSRSDVDADFRVAVSVSGVIDECRAVDGEVEEDLRKMVCAAVMRKRLFAPGTDPNGTAVRGIATFRVRLIRIPR